MSQRRFLDDPGRMLADGLASIPLTNPGVGLDAQNRILYVRPNYKSFEQQRVSLLCGGGSGHEPSFGGMVGPGLLSAAVAGTIFASPSAEQVRSAILSRIDNNGLENSSPEITAEAEDRGALVVVMNYTGDVLNFGVGVEMARAAGANVKMVVVGDDVSVGRSRAGKVGRRGIAGTVLVQKISGALAVIGLGLSQVARVATLVADNIATIGATLEQVKIPGVKAQREVGEVARDPRAVEIGMGIHNEQGWSREVLELNDIVAQMLQRLLSQDDPERSFVDFISDKPRVVLLVNNLGGLGVLELGAITTEVVRQLEEAYRIRPVRIYSGTYMTSLDAKGFSISLLRVVNLGLQQLEVDVLGLLDYPCEAPGWTANAHANGPAWESKDLGVRKGLRPKQSDIQPSQLRMNATHASKILEAGLRNIIASEPDITRFDLAVGDGDCGTTLKRGAEGVLHHLETKRLSGDVVVDVGSIACIIGQTMDGTSGAIYALFLNALVTALRSIGPGTVSEPIWAGALRQSADVLSRYTPAKIGDRTLIDALHPFITTLDETADLDKAAAVSKTAAQATKGMRASLGRSVYVGGSDFERVPDPGAWGLAQFFIGMAHGKQKQYVT